MSKRDIFVSISILIVGIGAAAMTQVGALVFPSHVALIFYLGLVLVVIGACFLLKLLLSPFEKPEAGRSAVKLRNATIVQLHDNEYGAGGLLEADDIGTLTVTKNKRVE